MLGQMMDFPLTIPAILRRAESLFGAREIVSRRADGTLHRSSYAECLERSRRLGNALLQLGLTPGSRVATLCWNHHRHLEAYFGVPSAGLVLHPLNLRLPIADLAYILHHAGDEALLVDEDLLPLLEGLPGSTALKHVVVCRDAVARGRVGDTLDYEDLIRSVPAPNHWDDPDEGSAAAMGYTSGTTGNPKGVVYSHRAMVLHSLACALPDGFALGESDVVLAAVPMFHANAWGLPFTAAMVGAAQVLPRNAFDAKTLLALLTGERVTFTAGVPTIWLGLAEEIKQAATQPDLSALRTIVVGGGSCPPSLIQYFEASLGLRVVTSWGMTELTPVGTIGRARTNRNENYRERARPGRPLPLVEARVSKDGRIAEWDGRTMGELQVRGPWVAAGYYADSTHDGITEDGWFRTGDIATIDPDGIVEIRDRAKDLIKSGGEWISSVALENGLLGHPAVSEAAVIAVSHPRWQERPLAIVKLREGSAVEAGELLEHLKGLFPDWYLPDRIEFTDRIPRTGTGKILKQALREKYGY
jgi:fatty-acyl-CoA synthase